MGRKSWIIAVAIGSLAAGIAAAAPGAGSGTTTTGVPAEAKAPAHKGTSPVSASDASGSTMAGNASSSATPAMPAHKRGKHKPR